MFRKSELKVELFPKLEKKYAGNFEKEYSELMEHRLIATLIPNELPYDDPLRLQKYFAEKLSERTGEEYGIKSKLVNRLMRLTKNFHENRINCCKAREIVDDGKCKNCNYDFKNGHKGIKEGGFYDLLNPGSYPLNEARMLDSKMDHIVPVSKIGGNNKDNFQYLCYICNSGKDNMCTNLDKLNLYSERVKIEKREAFLRQEEDFRFLPYALFFRVINRDCGCRFCNKKEYSLTVMPIDKDVLYTYDNLVTVCYGCLKKHDTIRSLRWEQC